MLSGALEKRFDVFVVSQDGQFLYASKPGADLDPVLLQRVLELAQPTEACRDCVDGVTVRWIDGATYLTAASELHPGRDPALGLGWRVLVRQPTELAFAQVRRSTAFAFGIGAVAALAAAVAAWFGAGRLSLPLVTLARSAAAVERGEAGASIPCLQSSREMEELSSSLASMTRRLVHANEELEQRVALRTQELRQSHAELHRVNVEQHAMLDNDMVGIMRLRERTIVWKNRAMGRMFGYVQDELLGQSSRVLYVDEASWEREGQRAYRILAAGERLTNQLEMRRKNGDPIWVEVSAMRLSPETGEILVMMTDITALKDHQVQIEHIAFHDALTGLANRLLLSDRLIHALEINKRLNCQLALCCIDLDGFKAVNDRLGHAAGDEVLKEVARRLLSCVRVSDTVARLGGDEFVLVLCPLEGPGECQVVLDRVIERVRQPVALRDGRIAQVTASIGIAFSPEHGMVPARLLRLADEAMYEAKHAGKNQVRFHRATRGTRGVLAS